MFKLLLSHSLNNRLLVVIASLVLMAYGAFSLSRMPVDVFPDLNKPTVTLMTEAGGMAAEEVEQLISLPLETAMSGLPGVESVRSVSSSGLSFIYLTFSWDSEIFRARQMVAERLGSMEQSLPPGVVAHMGPVTSIMGEIMQIALPIDAERISPMQVREYADWVLRPRLLAVPGVAQVIPIGGEVRQFQVQPDTRLMASLDISLEQLKAALQGYAANTSGGFLELNGREYLIRHLGRSSRLEDLQNLAVTARNGQPILLRQIANVTFAPAIKRGDAGYDGGPAVILSVQKQPAADTVALTRTVEAALADMEKALPPGLAAPRVTFRQANFIEASINNLEVKLLAASVFVAAVLFLFLGNFRTTFISLTAIPVSVLTTALVFKYFGLSINTMTLGGIAIAIGELVDDAVVDVENILRRLKLARARHEALSPARLLTLVRDASVEVRSAVVIATVIIALVFVPLFALPGIEGRLFAPLGTAYIVSILASLAVAVTLTPVLAWYLLPKMKHLHDGDTRLVRWLKERYRTLLQRVLARPRPVLAGTAAAIVLALAAIPFFPTTFLPPFNEGALILSLRLNPGATLAESVRMASQAEKLVRQVPEVEHVGRRSGRAELDEHAEGVHVTELDIRLTPSKRSKEEVFADLRQRLSVLPASLNLGQPISHRIDHMLSGVRAQIAIKIFGDDLDVLRAQAGPLQERLKAIPGLADLEIEKQVLSPQIQVRIDAGAAAQYGLSTAQLLASLQSLVDGERITQVVEGNRRFALVLRLPESARGTTGLEQLLIETPAGRVPLAKVAQIEESDGPNQISRDDGRRRLVISANAQGRALSDVVADIRAVVAAHPLPQGYFVTLGGQFQAQEEAARRIGLLSLVSALMIFLVLYSRYRSGLLAGLIMANVPLALVGSVIGLWLSGQPLSIAALIGFITLAGIATRNGILKVSHFLNLMRFEGEGFTKEMIIRGSLERLTPVLMTALVAAFALAPLLFEAGEPGTEILHPVAVVIFSGLISSTLLDTFLTPLLFWRHARPAAERLLAEAGGEAL